MPLAAREMAAARPLPERPASLKPRLWNVWLRPAEHLYPKAAQGSRTGREINAPGTAAKRFFLAGKGGGPDNPAMPNGMTPQAFIAKWRNVELSERAASQEHFIDLCRLLGQPTPAEHDATGAEYTFEKGVAVTNGASAGARGDRGFADVWWKGKFGWEYKRRGKYRDLTEAYRQLCQYREALQNPPLLIVSDIARTEIHTNFTGTIKQVHAIPLLELDRPEHLEKLRRVFTTQSCRPEITTERVTQEIAEQIGRIAQGLRQRGHDPHTAAHFLMKCMFCLFAEDVRLLPEGLFRRVLEGTRRDPARLTMRLTQLFAAMRTGGDVWTETGAGQPLPDDHHALAARRRETDQRVLANLLRLNLSR